MHAQELRRLIAAFAEHQPLTDNLMQEQLGFWADEKQHLMAWLNEYEGPGYYGRKQGGQDARHFYQHFQDVYGLLWLAEAAGISKEMIAQGCDAVRAAPKNKASQAAAFRRICPWNTVERQLHCLNEQT